MKKPVIEIEEGKLLVELKKQFYEREAIFAAAYKFTDLCSILIEPIDDHSVGVYFKPFKDSDTDLNKIAEAFCNEALDQQVRLDLGKRYGNIRDLIVKQAFAPIKNLKEKIDINE
ncbi:MAG: His-Xaa-Ser system protein HxsD [Candidatus Cloacimonetes bacterium]|nr:His-Xaa-Ser system protein HxsD [Candidatus Cloacimonadota bacterium]